MDYDRWLWGKREPFCSLSRHMIAVGACVMEYLGAPSSKGILIRLREWMNMDEISVLNMVGYVASLHDLGKAHPSFQPFSADEKEAPVITNFRHEQYGAMVLKALWKERGWDTLTRDFFSAVVRIHHQGKGSCDIHGSVSERWLKIHVSLEKRMRLLFAPREPVPTPNNLDALGVLLTAVLIIGDWVASSEGFGAEGLPELDDRPLLAMLRKRARDVLARYGLITDEESAFPGADEFAAMFPEISFEGMRPLQRVCEQAGERKAALTIIEAPMGEGKTEAALYVAGRLCKLWRKRGVYMALPTAATSNQMVGRVRQLLERHQSGSARLLHSMAWLIDDRSLSDKQFNLDDAQSAGDWLRPLRRGMLSENAVGTVDQAMAAALRIKYGFLRLAGLANKVLIIDEIHAYDVFMSTIIAGLLEWCRALSIPVILLSATMQDRQKQTYLACYGIDSPKLCGGYPLITQVTEAGELFQTPVSGTHMRGTVVFRPQKFGGDLDRIVDLALDRVANGGCICVMLNTVRQAQAVYRTLKERGESQIMLFHARFTAKRRAEIEKTCLGLFGRGGRRPDRMILVCTQVVEQSLDVDFDAMITQLAPMDLLLQRAGRVHRHAGNRRPAGMEAPVVDVVLPEPGATQTIDKRYVQIGIVYPPCVMKNTERMLEHERSVTIPDDVRACVEEAYRDISEEEEKETIKQLIINQLSISKAKGELLMPPDSSMFFAQIESNAIDLDLIDTDEDHFLSGGITRESTESQRFAFLPKGFPEQTENMDWLKKVMEFSCSCLVSKQSNIGLISKALSSRIEKDKNTRGCIILRENDDGFFRWNDMTFSCSDEYGIEEVPT